MDINQEVKMRISKAEELLSQVKDRTTLAYLLGLHGVKSDYEAIGDLENAYKYATLIIDLLSARKLVYSDTVENREKVNKKYKDYEIVVIKKRIKNTYIRVKKDLNICFAIFYVYKR